MWKLTGAAQHYAWGSTTDLPRLLGLPEDGTPWAEVWFGSHPRGTALLEDGSTLRERISADPLGTLGAEVSRDFRGELPFLLKAIAPQRALSLQVHPSREQALSSFAAENAAGVPLDSPQRSYRDDNHKPELLLALSPFTALCGLRPASHAIDVLGSLRTEVTDRLHSILLARPSPEGMHAALADLLSPRTRPTGAQVQEAVAACRARALTGDGHSARLDRIVEGLASDYPGDPGAVAALLLHDIELRPGEALFVPSGALHAYVRGVGIEVTASSDNVLRAALTSKKVDVEEMLRSVSVTPSSPVRIDPEQIDPATATYRAPVDDFALSVVTLPGGEHSGPLEHSLPGRGPRLLLLLEGTVRLAGTAQTSDLTFGDAVFLSADETDVRVSGKGRLVVAAVA
jgi:mannose-6-phosphate isomerase